MKIHFRSYIYEIAIFHSINRETCDKHFSFAKYQTSCNNWMTPVHVQPVLSWKVYHITNFLKGGYTLASCACDRQLYSKFSVKILLFNNCLGERLLYSQLSGDRQQYSRLSIDILPFNQLSGGKVTIQPVLGDILLYSQFP